MEFGMFHEFQRLPGASDASAFADSFAQVDAAERLGLDAMWLAELHFNPERSVLASPLILAAAIAARTKTHEDRHGGAGAAALPSAAACRGNRHHRPSRHGRLIFGVGRSGFAHTYKTYGVDYGESRERFSETLADRQARLHRGALQPQGQVLRLRQRPPVAQAGQPPWPEIRVAAASPDTYEEMGTMGHAIFVAARIGNLSELAPMVKSIRDAWKAAGHPGKGAVFLRVPVYVAETEAAAREEPEESILHLLRTIGSRLAESAKLDSARAIENRGERGAKMHVDRATTRCCASA